MDSSTKRDGHGPELPSPCRIVRHGASGAKPPTLAHKMRANSESVHGYANWVAEPRSIRAAGPPNQNGCAPAPAPPAESDRARKEARGWYPACTPAPKIPPVVAKDSAEHVRTAAVPSRTAFQMPGLH